jgi:hypothetical protein
MRAHIAAIIALGKTATFPGYDAEVPDDAVVPYWFLTAPTLRADEDQQAVSGVAVDLADYVQVTAVGGDADQARWAQEHLYAALHKKSPTITGWRTFMKRTASGVLAVDRTVTLPVTGNPVYSVDTYHYTATPAT